jgi:hypothetical protein
MSAKTKTNRRLTKELLETVNDMRASGLLSKAAHEKIIKRHLCDAPVTTAKRPLVNHRHSGARGARARNP